MSNIANYYQNKALKYSSSSKRLQNILDLAGNISNSKILDIGCSTGYMGKLFRKNHNRVFGVDISTKAVTQAKKVLDFAEVVDVNNSNLPFKSNYFDLVICSEVVEHLFQPDKLLQQIHRVLKSDGVLILTTPNLLYWGHRITLLKGRFAYQNEGPFDEGHIHFYSYSSLLEDLSKARLELVSQNNVYMGNSFKQFRNKYPGIFAYQFVLKCQKL